MSKNKLNQSAIQQLLRRTFYRRRLAILDDPNPKSVKEITEMFPALRKLSFVSVHCMNVYFVANLFFTSGSFCGHIL